MFELRAIKEWSEVFGLPIGKKPHFPENKEEVDFCLRLIEEEFSELKKALEEKNLTEVCDGAGDVIWTVVRLLLHFGIDPDKVMNEVYTSNMSKADFFENEAKRTLEKYQEQGIPVFQREIEGHILTYRESDGKLLKSANFIEPNFKKCLSESI